MKAFNSRCLFPALLCIFLFACDTNRSGAKQLQLTGPTMGTTYTVKARGVSVNTADLQTEIEGILADINRKMSTYDPDSELSRFNQNPSTDWVEISEDLHFVMSQAQAISVLSEGAFDVTVGPLVNLWGFGPQLTQQTIPSQKAIEQIQAQIGYQLIQLGENPAAMKKVRPDVSIDLSAIAKGYAVDRLADYLESLGFPHYLVEIGGELRGKGSNPQGQPWSIAIEQPTPGKRAVEQVIWISDQGVATSGNYRNFFDLDGQRYSHAINPHSGWPIKHKLGSVTVVAKTTILADAMATALLVLGPEAGLELAETQNLAAFFIIANEHGFSEKSTSAFAQYLLK